MLVYGSDDPIVFGKKRYVNHVSRKMQPIEESYRNLIANGFTIYVYL